MEFSGSTVAGNVFLPPCGSAWLLLAGWILLVAFGALGKDVSLGAQGPSSSASPAVPQPCPTRATHLHKA